MLIHVTACIGCQIKFIWLYLSPPLIATIFAALPPLPPPPAHRHRFAFDCFRLLILFLHPQFYAPFTIWPFSTMLSMPPHSFPISNATHYYFNTVGNFRQRQRKTKEPYFFSFPLSFRHLAISEC